MSAKDFKHEEPYSACTSHGDGELFVFSRGAAKVIVNSVHWLLTPGIICWVPPHAPHAVIADVPVEGISVHIAESESSRLRAFPAILKPTKFLLALMRRIADGCQADQQLHLLRVLQQELKTATEHDLFLPMPEDTLVSAITKRLAARPEDDRELSEWASEAGVSSRSLARHFKVHTNSSFVQWRSLARIMSSVPLLLKGHQVSSVSAAVGYEDTSAFIQLFKQTVGSSPRQYAIGLQHIESALLPQSPKEPAG